MSTTSAWAPQRAAGRSSFLWRRRGVVAAATAAKAKKGSVAAGMYQFQSIVEEARYAVRAAALPASIARLVVLEVERAL